MRRLTLVRHASAGWSGAAGRDFDRPLTPEGEADCVAMGRALTERRFAPERILCSPAERAYRTAELLAAEIGFPHPRIESFDRLYLASSQEMEELIRATEATCSHLALVGHNPGIGELAQRLGATLHGGMVTCAVVQLELDVGAWDEVASGCGRLIAFERPGRGPVGDPG